MAVRLSEVGVFQCTPVLEAQLTSKQGVEISILSYGAIVRDWMVPVSAKQKRSVVLGFESWEKYLLDSSYLGAIIGRVANRTANAQFKMNGIKYSLPVNNGLHHHHGGPLGLSKKNWSLTLAEEENAVILKVHSPAGDMGYPGDVDFTVIYRLSGYDLDIQMQAQASASTPINMVQHHYFNLVGSGEVFDHHLQICADQYTVLGEDMIPTGEIAPVHGTIFDFTTPRDMRIQGQPQAYDLNFVLNKIRNFEQPIAAVTAPDNSLCLKLWTDQPGLQLYNGHYLDPAYTGLCLEDQNFPNAVNIARFPSPLVTPQNPYRHWCKIRISDPNT